MAADRIGLFPGMSRYGAEWELHHWALLSPRKTVIVGTYLRRIVTKPCIEPRVHIARVPICCRLTVEGLHVTTVVAFSSRRGRCGANAWKSYRRRSDNDGTGDRHDETRAVVSDACRTLAPEKVKEDVATVAIAVGNEVDPGPCLS